MVKRIIDRVAIRGFYFDMEHEHDTTYGLITNLLVNGDTFDETKTDQT
jgi:hypothetical protein